MFKKKNYYFVLHVLFKLPKVYSYSHLKDRVLCSDRDPQQMPSFIKSPVQFPILMFVCPVFTSCQKIPSRALTKHTHQRQEVNRRARGRLGVSINDVTACVRKG